MQLDENIKVATKSLLDHKLRLLLTMLGIIFGVAAVIAMLSKNSGLFNATTIGFIILLPRIGCCKNGYYNGKH